MAIINYNTREINAKIVYYGPGLCGKTTNIKFVHQKLRPDTKGKLLSLATETDRTLFFDFLPVDLGDVKGYKTRFHLYTVPGQVFYNSTRKLVLKGADGIVFVADSQRDMIDANLQSLANLRENLTEQGKNLDDLPMVIQCNKRDLPNVMEMEELDRLLNPRKLPILAASAQDGTGVLPTLTAIARMVLFKLRESISQTQTQSPADGMGDAYRAARKTADNFATALSGGHPSATPVIQPSPSPPTPAPPPLPAAPPPPPPLVIAAVGTPATTSDPARIVLPVSLAVHGKPTQFKLQIRVGLDSTGAVRTAIESFSQES